MDFVEIAVQERGKGTPSSKTAEILLKHDSNVPVDSVVYAFAVAGYPVFDTVLGTRAYFISKMGFYDPEIEEIMIKKLKEVNYPEEEIQEALHRVVG